MTVRAINTSFVNVYELDRVYGGPEEGGWWFTTGTTVKSLVVPSIEANDYAALLEELFPRGSGRDSCGSVMYGGGDYTVCIEDEPASDWPDEYPHYE